MDGDQVTTPVAGGEVVAPGAASTQASAGERAALDLARRALVAAHPDAIAELIVGDTPEALEASVAVARQAYAAIAERVRGDLASSSAPVGAPARSDASAEQVAAMSASAKIAVGLLRRQQR